MKSNKQRRAEINAKRLERASRIEAQLRAPNDGRRKRLVGSEPVDFDLLARLNNTYADLPSHYVDRSFNCRDCGEACVWTAKQQKWWYETARGNINSTAVRCLACRRKHQAQVNSSSQGQGADLLGETVRWLRGVRAHKQDAATVARVEELLTSKWDSLRQLATEVLGRWERPQDFARLLAMAQDESLDKYDVTRRAAVQALVPQLQHPRDDAWVLEACVTQRRLWHPASAFVRHIDNKSLNQFLADEVQRDASARLVNSTHMLMDARRAASPTFWRHVSQHKDANVAHAAYVAQLRFAAIVPPHEAQHRSPP